MTVRERGRAARVKPGGTAGKILSQHVCWDGFFVFLSGTGGRTMKKIPGKRWRREMPNAREEVKPSAEYRKEKTP